MNNYNRASAFPEEQPRSDQVQLAYLTQRKRTMPNLARLHLQLKSTLAETKLPILVA